MIQKGIYTESEMSIDAYHEDREYISSSGLKAFMQSPRHLQALFSEENVETSYFNFGHAFEAMLLSPETFDDKFFILNDKTIISLIGGSKPRATKRYKEWKADEVIKANGRIIIPATGADSMEVLDILIHQCRQDELVSALIKNIEYQSSVFWKDEQSQVLCKTRPDIIHVNKKVVLDIKTDLSSAPGTFARRAAKLHYPVQAALQMRGVIASGMMDSVDLYYYLVAEKTSPYNVQLYRMTKDDIAAADSKLNDTLLLYKMYKKGDLRLGYNFLSDNKYGILDLNIPQYYWYD